MKQKLPTILILLVMVLVGAIYWVDLCYYTDPATGFVTRGPVWARYVVLVLPLFMCLLGLRTVGPKALSVMRVRNVQLGGVFMFAAAVGALFGVTRILYSINPLDIYQIIFGTGMVWYGVWMLMAGLQLVTENPLSPTKSAIWGVLAALPYAMSTVYRILVNPSSIHRIMPLVRSLAALVAMLWFGFLLRSLYIALPRRRVRWLYLTGVLTFLFAACLELPGAVFDTAFGSGQPIDLLESVNMATLGLVAGCVSVSVAGRSAAVPRTAGAADSIADEDEA